MLRMHDDCRILHMDNKSRVALCIFVHFLLRLTQVNVSNLHVVLVKSSKCSIAHTFRQ